MQTQLFFASISLVAIIPTRWRCDCFIVVVKKEVPKTRRWPALLRLLIFSVPKTRICAIFFNRCYTEAPKAQCRLPAFTPNKKRCFVYLGCFYSEVLRARGLFAFFSARCYHRALKMRIRFSFLYLLILRSDELKRKRLAFISMPAFFQKQQNAKWRIDVAMSCSTGHHYVYL